VEDTVELRRLIDGILDEARAERVNRTVTAEAVAVIQPIDESIRLG